MAAVYNAYIDELTSPPTTPWRPGLVCIAGASPTRVTYGAKNYVCRIAHIAAVEFAANCFTEEVAGGSSALGSSGQWLVDVSGNFVPSTNGAFDIGTSGGVKPRNLFLTGDITLTGGVFRLGGSTNGDAALRRSGNMIQARLGDDSGWGTFQGNIRLPNAFTSGAPTATGYLSIQDVNGTTYRLLCAP